LKTGDSRITKKNEFLLSKGRELKKNMRAAKNGTTVHREREKAKKAIRCGQRRKGGARMSEGQPDAPTRKPRDQPGK